MTSGRIAVATKETPYLVARRLRRLGGPELGRRDRHALAWIEQAANLIDQLAIERQRLILAANNYSRAKCRVVRIERSAVKSAPKVKQEPRSGRLVRNGPAQAEMVADLITGPVDLYRVERGVRVVKAGAKVKQGEYLGRFDEGADFQDIKEALEHE
jgi:hypothetical protein